MPLQLSLLAEVPSTLGTPERCLPDEDFGVFCESAMFGQSLTTLSTEWSFSTMHMLVDILEASQAEALAALWTLKGSFSCVCLAETCLLRL